MSISTWSINQVSDWVEDLGFDGKVFKQEKIDGQVLLAACHEMIQQLGIESLQKRNIILNQIYKQKVLFDIEIEQGEHEPFGQEPDFIQMENLLMQQSLLRKEREEKEVTLVANR